MTTRTKAEKKGRTACLPPDIDRQLLSLRAFYEKKTGQTHAINDIFIKAIEALAKANKIA